MKQNAKTAIVVVPCAVIAFLAGVFVGNLPFTKGIGLGEVGRAQVYTKHVVDVDVDNVQERILADSLYLVQVASQALWMYSQANTLSSLVEKTNALVGNNTAFDATIEAVNGANKTIDNACNNLDIYLKSLDNLADKKKVAQFEQIYNNALLSYYLVNEKSLYGQIFGQEAAAYLQSGQAADTAEVKNLWSEWLAFELAGDIMSGDAKGSKEVLEMSDNNGLAAVEKLNAFLNSEHLQRKNEETFQALHIFNQEQLNILRLVNEEQFHFFLRFMHFDQEQLHMDSQEQLNMEDQEQLNMKISSQEQQNSYYRSQEQLNSYYRSQEQLKVYNQEQLNTRFNQEQLELARNNQEQLHTFVVNQEQLNANIRNKEQLNRLNQEQLQVPNQEQLQGTN